MDLMEARDERIARTREWLEWATAQIDVTLAADAEAASQLASAVYGVLDDPRLTGHGGLSAPSHEVAVSAAMQQHDRLMQQMTHVSAALRSLTETLSLRAGEADWDKMRAQQLSIFSMYDERALFQLLVPDLLGGGAAESPTLDGQSHAPDSVELF